MSLARAALPLLWALLVGGCGITPKRDGVVYRCYDRAGRPLSMMAHDAECKYHAGVWRASTEPPAR